MESKQIVQCIESLKNSCCFLSNKRLLIPGASAGNISVRLDFPDNDDIVITASGECLDSLRHGDQSFSRISIEDTLSTFDCIEKDTLKLDDVDFASSLLLTVGSSLLQPRATWRKLQPKFGSSFKMASIEAALHAGVYQALPNAMCIFHIHSPSALKFSCLNPDKIDQLFRSQCNTQSIFGDNKANIVPYITGSRIDKVGPIVWCPFLPPGTFEMHTIVTKIFEGTRAVAMILQNHGLICLGSTIREAQDCVAEVEQELSILLYHCQTLSLSDINLLSVEDIEWKRINTGVPPLCRFDAVYYPNAFYNLSSVASVGFDQCETLPNEIKHLWDHFDATFFLIITSRDFPQKILDYVLQICNSRDFQYSHIKPPEKNWTAVSIDLVVKELCNSSLHPQAVFAIGDSSVLDASKNIASLLCQVQNQSVNTANSMYTGEISSPLQTALPIIAISSSLFGDTQHSYASCDCLYDPSNLASLKLLGFDSIIKSGHLPIKPMLRLANATPYLSILDPNLLLDHSYSEIIQGVLVTISNAIEAVTAVHSSMLSSILAFRSIQLVVHALSIFQKHPKNKIAIYEFSYASLLAGHAVDTAGPHLITALANSLCAVSPKLPFGMAVACLLAPSVLYLLPHSKILEHLLSLLLGSKYAHKCSDDDICISFFGYIDALRAFNTPLYEFGVNLANLQIMVASAFGAEQVAAHYYRPPYARSPIAAQAALPESFFPVTLFSNSRLSISPLIVRNIYSRAIEFPWYVISNDSFGDSADLRVSHTVLNRELERQNNGMYSFLSSTAFKSLSDTSFLSRFRFSNCYFGQNSLSELRCILFDLDQLLRRQPNGEALKSIAVITGLHSFESCWEPLFALLVGDEFNLSVLQIEALSNKCPSAVALDAALEQLNNAAKPTQALISIGGSSTIYTVKCLALLLANPKYSAKQLFSRKIPVSHSHINGALPIICINTTHGTGAEAHRYAAGSFENDVTDHAITFIGYPCTLPFASICDPELVVSLPHVITVMQCVDIIAHAMECVTSPNSTPYVELLSSVAVYCVAKYLPNVKTTDRDVHIDARTYLMLASFLAGKAVDITGLHLLHALAHTISSLNNRIPHGYACAILIPSVMQHIYIKRSAVLVRIMAPIIGNDLKGHPSEAKLFATKLESWIQHFGLKKKLPEWNINDPEKFIQILHSTPVSSDTFMANCPISVDDEMVSTIFRESSQSITVESTSEEEVRSEKAPPARQIQKKYSLKTKGPFSSRHQHPKKQSEPQVEKKPVYVEKKPKKLYTPPPIESPIPFEEDESTLSIHLDDRSTHILDQTNPKDLSPPTHLPPVSNYVETPGKTELSPGFVPATIQAVYQKSLKDNSFPPSNLPFLIAGKQLHTDSSEFSLPFASPAPSGLLKKRHQRVRPSTTHSKAYSSTPPRTAPSKIPQRIMPLFINHRK